MRGRFDPFSTGSFFVAFVPFVVTFSYILFDKEGED